jgi:predicted esterase
VHTALGILASLACAGGAADVEPPREWLVLASVDERGRRPFRPDAVLAHLAADPLWEPRAGEEERGSSARAVWEARRAEQPGALGGGFGWAFAALELETRANVLADLRGATTLWVNGAPFVGDPYGYGFGGVPVALAPGRNRIFVTGPRGDATLAFSAVDRALVLATADCTVPDILVGGDRGLVGIPLLETQGVRHERLFARAAGEAFTEVWSPPFALEPLQVLKLPLLGILREPARAPGSAELEIEVSAGPGQPVLARARVAVTLRDPAGLQRLGRISEIDGSVQEMSVLPPRGARAPDVPARLLLTLHGAGVDSWGQAASYAPKPDFWIVAPTNRRPFGFDWQDWGRLDAYEALDEALRLSGVARSRVYLSGHSMGGHGAWHLAANDPDGFAAVAPSAAWRSFDSYGGRPAGALATLWQAADRASRTEDLLANLRQLPAFVLHGAADDNVPVSEAQAMSTALAAAGGEVRTHVQEGAGHWWSAGRGGGTDCVDWPEFFELFRARAIPAAPAALEFTTVDPCVDAQHYWVRVEELERYGEAARVVGRYDRAARALFVEAWNVRRLATASPDGQEVRAEVLLHGERERAGHVEGWLEGSAYAEGERIVFEPHGALPRGEKSPGRGGPLKRAFDRRFVLVVPSGGNAEENRVAYERARHDAQVWWYRGNGHAPIVRDAEWLAERAGSAGRNVILYGNAETNRAWAVLVGPDSPVVCRRGAARVGGTSAEGDGLDLLAVRPRADDAQGLVGLACASGPQGDRVATSLALFVSGVGYPDYALFGPDVLASGDGGVIRAGWFDAHWLLQP